jgi:hypothetical protein
VRAHNQGIDGTKFGSAYGSSGANYTAPNAKKNTMPMRIIYKTKYVYRFLKDLRGGKKGRDGGGSGGNSGVGGSGGVTSEKLDPGRYDDQVSNAQVGPSGTVFMTDNSGAMLVSPAKSRQSMSRISPYKASPYKAAVVGSPKSEKKPYKHSPYKTLDVAGKNKTMDVYGMVEDTRKKKAVDN